MKMVFWIKNWRDFLNGVANSYTRKFENIAQVVSHPIETTNNAKVNYQNQSVGERVTSSIIGAVDGATGGIQRVSSIVCLRQIIYFG